MKIKIICVGKLKEKYLEEGVKEYLKRLSAYCDVEVIEVGDERIPENPSLAEEMIVKSKEGRRILDKVKQDDYMILLDVQGKEVDSIQFAESIEDCMLHGKSTIDFVIGGSLDILQICNERVGKVSRFLNFAVHDFLISPCNKSTSYNSFSLIPYILNRCFTEYISILNSIWTC